jgi:hypothetical protein
LCRVKFPDVLNLNSFIESKFNQDSPSREEDGGIKGDDVSTSDSSIVDEECITNDVKMSNSNHFIHPDQDDEGLLLY